MTELQGGHPPRIPSFVAPEGRMTRGKKNALERLWPRLGLENFAQTVELAKVFCPRPPEG